MDQRRNHKGNEKILQDEWKWKKTAYQNLGNAVKVILGGELIAVNNCIEKVWEISNQ